MKFTMLGAGAYGEALGGILEKNGHFVTYYDPAKYAVSLPEALDGAEAMVLCVPSAVAPVILPDLPHDLLLIVATKGLLSDTVFRDFDDVMAVSGPGFAQDLTEGRRTSLVITDRRVGEWLHQPWLTLVETDDLKGVLMCGALKNVYAIGAGMRRLEEDSGEWYQYIEKAVAEMREILLTNGAQARTATLPCGRGDLELTCALPSRNFEFGLQLSEDPLAQPAKTVEGLATLKRLRDGEIIVPAGAEILRELIEQYAQGGAEQSSDEQESDAQGSAGQSSDKTE